MNIIGHKKIYLSISAILIIASVVFLVTLGLKQGIDFTGGTLWQLQFSDSVSKKSVESFFKSLPDVSEATVSKQGPGLFLMRLSEISEANHQNYLKDIQAKIGTVEELSFETIGPAISSELRSGSLKVFILVLLAI